MRRYLYFLGIAVITVLAFSVPSNCYSQDYRVGEGDVLRMTVYGHDDLTTVERVGGDGTITFPLIGTLHVGGLTVNEVSRKLSSLLGDGYIVEPQAAVFIEEFRSQKVVIMGELVRPGLYELKGYITFLQLVSMAGGLTEDAGPSAVIKRRHGEGAEGEFVETIDLRQLIEEGDTSLDVPIMDGDTIYISKSGVFYITGEVKKPDAYRYEEGTSIIQAITMAGGLTDKASASRVKIIRKIDGEEKVFEKVKMDMLLRPDDVIVIPESFF